MGATATDAAGRTASIRRALEVIYDAAARGDLEAFIGGMHPDVEIHDTGPVLAALAGRE